MKDLKKFAPVLIVAVVLVGALVVGLVVHLGRTDDSPEGADVNIPSPEAPTAVSPGRNAPETDDAETRARVREQRAQVLEQMQSLTPEEREKFLQDFREQFGRMTARPEQPRSISPEERERLLQEWQKLPEEQRRATIAELQERVRRARERRQQESAPNAPDAGVGTQ